MGFGTPMASPLAIATALCIFGLVVAAQPTSSSARLSQVVDTLVAGQGRGAPRPDAEALLATLKDIKATELSPAEDIERRFAETILVGREISAEHRSGPMGKEAYTRMLREQYLLPYDLTRSGPTRGTNFIEPLDSSRRWRKRSTRTSPGSTSLTTSNAIIPTLSK